VKKPVSGRHPPAVTPPPPPPPPPPRVRPPCRHRVSAGPGGLCGGGDRRSINQAYADAPSTHTHYVHGPTRISTTTTTTATTATATTACLATAAVVVSVAASVQCVARD